MITFQNWQQAWNLMKIYLPLNKAEIRCENDSELTKGLELDEIYLSKRKRKNRCENNSTNSELDEDFFTKKKKWENDSELTKGVELDQIFLSKRKSQKVVVKTEKNWQQAWNLMKIYLPHRNWQKACWQLAWKRLWTWWIFIYRWTSRKVIAKTIQNWQEAWNLMKFYLQLNKAESRYENDSELTKSVELD